VSARCPSEQLLQAALTCCLARSCALDQLTDVEAALPPADQPAVAPRASGPQKDRSTP